MAAIDLTESLDSALGVDLLCDLTNQLQPHATLPAVRDFVARARDLVPA